MPQGKYRRAKKTRTRPTMSAVMQRTKDAMARVQSRRKGIGVRQKIGNLRTTELATGTRKVGERAGVLPTGRQGTIRRQRRKK